MSLNVIYQKLRNSIVAFVPRYIPLRGNRPLPKYPPIFGTGFVVREDGLIATNAHVAKSFKKIYKPSTAPKDEWPVYALLLKIVKEGMKEVRLDILSIFAPTEFIPGKVYYGPKEGPDVAFVQVKAKGMIPVELDSSTLVEEGIDVGTAGFPMGTDMLTAPGRLTQITPTLQRGIVSAVHPFFTASPHCYSINIMAQGGASGSPVFLCDTGKVIGVLSSIIYNKLPIGDKGGYLVPTNISYAVPSHYIENFMAELLKSHPSRLPSDAETIDQMIENRGYRNVLEEGRDWVVKIDPDLERKRVEQITKLKPGQENT